MKITFEMLENELDKTYQLVYVNYNENFDHHMSLVNGAIQSEDGWYKFLEESDEWYWEARANYSWDIADDIIKKVCDEHDVSEEERDAIRNVFMDELRMIIEERDVSDPIRDALGNTSQKACFFELDWDEPTFGYGFSDDDSEALASLKEELGINHDQYNNKLINMLNSAYGGGTLVVYFTVDDWNSFLDEMNTNPDTVTFNDPVIAIVNHVGGAGSDTWLKGHTLTTSFSRTKVWVDEVIKYNYTHAVCGMYDNWCDSTGYEFSKTGLEWTPEDSPTAARYNRDAEYERTFKAGGCTKGDIDMRRHRNTYYKNEFPCGTHCPHCGMFWID